jgi:hypothetical protein
LRASHDIRTRATVCRARFAALVATAGKPVPAGLADDAGTGAVPHSAANEASLRNRSEFPPAVINSWAAVFGAHPAQRHQVRVSRAGQVADLLLQRVRLPGQDTGGAGPEPAARCTGRAVGSCLPGRHHANAATSLVSASDLEASHASQAGAVGAGALDPDDPHRTERRHERQRGGVAGWCGTDSRSPSSRPTPSTTATRTVSAWVSAPVTTQQSSSGLASAAVTVVMRLPSVSIRWVDAGRAAAGTLISQQGDSR